MVPEFKLVENYALYSMYNTLRVHHLHAVVQFNSQTKVTDLN